MTVLNFKSGSMCLYQLVKLTCLTPVNDPCELLRAEDLLFMIILKNTVKWIDENDSYLLFPKSIFFLVNFILYATYTYQLDYLADVWELNITSSGFITSIPVVSFFSAIAWSSLAQRTGMYKEIIVAVVVLNSVCFASFQGFSSIMAGSEDWKRFAVVSAIYGCMSILASALFPLLDHKMYTKLAKDRRFSPEIFGRQRLWGTIGQGVSGFVTGWGIKHYGYVSIFYYSAIASFTFILLVIFGFESSHSNADAKTNAKTNSKTDAKATVETEENKSQVEKISWMMAMRKLMHLRFISFLLVILVASYSRAIVGNFLVRYLRICLKINKDTSGFLILMRTLPEIACFFFSKNMLHTFGVNNMLLFAQIAGLIRVTTYAWLPEEEKWVPFVIESLRGVNNAFLMASGVRLAHELAPVEAQTVAQGFFHGIFGNLTTGTAGMLASLISLHVKKNNENYSDADIIRIIFKVSSCGSIVGLLFFGFFYLISRKTVTTKPLPVLKS